MHASERVDYSMCVIESFMINYYFLVYACSVCIGVIGVVKAGAYGHGSVHVSRRLKATGVERLAVATVGEAIHLRDHDISGPIHMFGKRRAICPCAQAHRVGG